MLRLTSLHKLFVVVHAALLFIPAPVNAVTVDEARSKGLAWLALQQQGDGGFKSAFGLPIQTSAAALDAMRIGGLAKSPQFNRAVGWLSNAPASSLDARSWQIQSLSSAGVQVGTLAAVVRDSKNVATVSPSGVLNANSGAATWGPFVGYAASSADTALALGALRSGGLRYNNDDLELSSTLLCFLLPAQKTVAPWSGAWSYALPLTQQPNSVSSGSFLATAILTFELKRLMQTGRANGQAACGRTIPSDVNNAVSNAKNWMLGQRNSDGGFAERNLQTSKLEPSNIVLTSLAIRALQLFAAEDAIVVGATTTAQAWLASQQNNDGSWRGDAFITARALAALPNAQGAQALDSDKDGLTDVVEQSLGTNSQLADSQNNLRQNANAAVGLTATAFSVNGVLNQPFSYSISTSGGTTPFTFTRKTGELPQGLTLSPAGAINGTPVQSGIYAFDYEVRDSTGKSSLIIGRIDISEVVAQEVADGDIPIPLWALVLLGIGLMGTAIKRAQS